jgi:hypothetical protein
MVLYYINILTGAKGSTCVGFTNRPCSGGHSKYLTPCTSPSLRSPLSGKETPTKEVCHIKLKFVLLISCKIEDTKEDEDDDGELLAGDYEDDEDVDDGDEGKDEPVAISTPQSMFS